MQIIYLYDKNHTGYCYHFTMELAMNNLYKIFMIFLYFNIYAIESGIGSTSVSPEKNLISTVNKDLSHAVIDPTLQKQFQQHLRDQLPSDSTFENVIQNLKEEKFPVVKFESFYSCLNEATHKKCKICTKKIHSHEICEHILRHGNILFKCPVPGCNHKGVRKKYSLLNHYKKAATSNDVHQVLFDTLLAATKRIREKQNIKEQKPSTAGSAYLVLAVKNQE